MSLPTVSAILIKELKCFFTSKRIIANTFLFAAVTIPVLLSFGGWAMQTQKKSAGISHVGVPSEAGAAALHSQENIRTEILDFPTAKEKILKGQLDVFFDQETGKIYYSSMITSSATAAGVLDKAFGSAGGVELVSLSDAAADNIMAYTLIPAGLMLICSMSAGTFAAACTVREREMGTLEPLLSTGVSPFVIVVGKVLSVILASLLSVFICAIGTTLYLRLFLNSLQVITLSFISLLFITGILTSDSILIRICSNWSYVK